MDSFQALGLCENALRFNVEVTFPNKETRTFEVFTRYTVDKVKALALANTTGDFSANDYLLGFSESEKLDIEFAKFIVCHPKVKEALESAELVKVGLFKRGMHSPNVPREKIELNADINMAALRTNLETVIMSPKPTREKDKDKSDKLQRRNSFSEKSKEESPKSEKKSALSSLSIPSFRFGSKPKEDTSQSNLIPDTSSPSYAARAGSLRLTKPRLSASSLLMHTESSPTPGRASNRNSIPMAPYTPPESPTMTPKASSTPELPELKIVVPSQIAQAKGFTYEDGTPGVTLNLATQVITDPLKSQPWYNMYFHGKEHFNYIGNDGTTDTYIVSVIKEEDTTPQDKNATAFYRVIIRTKKGDEKRTATVKNSKKKKPPIKDIIQASYPALVGKKLSTIKETAVCADLKNFEDRQLIKNYKFGVLYCAPGQTDEEQMFSNVKGSADWEEFLGVLGAKVELQGWPNYRAGLDVKTGTTGTHSVHTKYKDYEVMFHVSTLLPHDAVNPQQLERKRHLGNDIVVIVFKEGDQLYDPNCIKSEFNHIFVVVSKVQQNQRTYYKVSIACKEGVPPFVPDLPDPPLIEKSSFRDFLLCKLINGENTSYEAPAFKMKIQRTRLTLLKDIASRIK